jgi:hypothetical protein
MEEKSTPTTDQAIPAKSKLHWYQYHLRTLLILMTLLAIVCSLIVPIIQRKIERRKIALQEKALWRKIKATVVKAIAQSGGKMPSWQLDPNIEEPMCWIQFKNDAELEPLMKIPELKDFKVFQLLLEGPQITDKGLEYLKVWPQFRSLIIEKTNITDAGLMHLKELRHLEFLTIDNANITDAGLEYLKDLPNLEMLSLYKTNITDAGLNYLKELKYLNSLNLMGTRVTDIGIEDLHKTLPNLHIER